MPILKRIRVFVSKYNHDSNFRIYWPRIRNSKLLSISIIRFHYTNHIKNIGKNFNMIFSSLDPVSKIRTEHEINVIEGYYKIRDVLDLINNDLYMNDIDTKFYFENEKFRISNNSQYNIEFSKSAEKVFNIESVKAWTCVQSLKKYFSIYVKGVKYIRNEFKELNNGFQIVLQSSLFREYKKRIKIMQDEYNNFELINKRSVYIEFRIIDDNENMIDIRNIYILFLFKIAIE